MKTQYQWLCTHCDTPLSKPFASPQSEDKPVFCCDGCKVVYGILTSHHLDKYYAIKKQSPSLKEGSPVQVSHHRYDYLDDKQSSQKYTYGSNHRQMNFYIEGIHCVACLWLIERIGMLVPGVKNAQLDLSTNLLKVSLGEQGSFAMLADTLQQLGYTPHPVTTDEQSLKMKKDEMHKQILQTGIAGFCAGNIMLMFISIYAGVEGWLLTTFLWSSFALSLPVISYCAFPFYKSALTGLLMRQINIDIPVSLALLFGFLASTYHLFTGSSEVYYDSLAIFVFLLLSTRLFLKTLHQKVSGSTHYDEWLMPKYVDRYSPEKDQCSSVLLDTIHAGNIIRISENSIIPADGVIMKGEGYIDSHMLTGESKPHFVSKNTSVYAGTMLKSGEIFLTTQHIGEQTRLSQMLKSIQSAQKPNIVTLADSIAKWFLFAVILLGASVMIYYAFFDFSEGFRRTLSLIIVACPCALALATPLAYTIGLKKCSMIGALLKGPEVLERLALTKHIFLDKTGTLTHGGFHVISWEILIGEDPLFNIAHCLEQQSKHPIAIAIRDYVEQQSIEIQKFPLNQYKEILGQGVFGYIGDNFYEIKNMMRLIIHPQINTIYKLNLVFIKMVFV